MKFLVIPDIHGNYTAALQNIKDHKDEVDKVVVLGDYVDDFNEDLNGQPMVDGFNQLIEFKDKEPEKFELLFGNHCLSYLPQTRYGEGVSGHHHEYAEMYKKMFRDNIDKLNIVYREGNILFSHAGVSQQWLQHVKYFANKAHEFDKVPQELMDRYNDLDYKSHNINEVYFDGFVFSLVNAETPEEEARVKEYRKIQEYLHGQINKTFEEMMTYKIEYYKYASYKFLNEVFHSPHMGDPFNTEIFEHCGWNSSGDSSGESCTWIRPDSLLNDNWPRGIKYQVVGHTECGNKNYVYKNKHLILTDSPGHYTYRILDSEKMDELEYIEYENAPKRNVSDTDTKLLKLLGLL
jgi:predicted phosphodiesterase